MPYFYIYKMVHPETKEFYIGKRKSEFPPEEDSYRGSSQSWYNTLSKEIIHNVLLKEIIEDGISNEEDLHLAEIKWISENIKNPLCKNSYIPGIGFYTSGPLSDDHKKKIGESCKGKIWINDGINSTTIDSLLDIPKGWFLGRLPYTENHRKNISEKLKGRSLTESHKKSISESLKTSDNLKEIMNSDEYKQKISNSLKGRKFTDEHKAKLSIAAKSRPPITEETRNKLKEARNKRVISEETKLKISKTKPKTSKKHKNDIHPGINPDDGRA